MSRHDTASPMNTDKIAHRRDRYTPVDVSIDWCLIAFLRFSFARQFSTGGLHNDTGDGDGGGSGDNGICDAVYMYIRVYTYVYTIYPLFVPCCCMRNLFCPGYVRHNCVQSMDTRFHFSFNAPVCETRLHCAVQIRKIERRERFPCRLTIPKLSTISDSRMREVNENVTLFSVVTYTQRERKRLSTP